MYRTSAILVAGNRRYLPAANESDFTNADGRGSRAEALANVEVFGESVIERIAARLLKSGIQKVHVITGEPGVIRRRRNVVLKSGETLNSRLQAAGRALEEYARQSLEVVLLAELGSYVEFDVAAAIQFHRDKGQIATPLYDAQGSLGWWIIDPARWQSNRDSSTPLRGDEMPGPPAPYFAEGYANRLETPQDLRRLIVDAFCGRCGIAPQGREIRPGIWIDAGARLGKNARLVAPAYIGRHTQVESEAVVTRFSNLESHCFVGEGSVVNDSSVLPHTTIGKGLDVCAAVVNGSEYFDLARNASVKIQDPRLISGAAPASTRTPHLPEVGQVGRPQAQPEMEYSYLSRAAGRLLEVFKGEV